MGRCSRHAGKKDAGSEQVPEEATDEKCDEHGFMHNAHGFTGPDVSQAFRGAECEHLLTENDEDEDVDPKSMKAKAAREVERILAAPNQHAVLGAGTQHERTARFRK